LPDCFVVATDLSLGRDIWLALLGARYHDLAFPPQLSKEFFKDA